MSVLVKGMEMPRSCQECPCEQCYVNNYGYVICRECSLLHKRSTMAFDNERREDCPLIELSPHGDLIDRDALHEELYALEYARENEWLDGVREARGVDAARVALLDAPTIIPAEGEGT